MPIIDADALRAIIVQESAAILAGEDLLDTKDGESALSPETVALLNAKRDYSVARKSWAESALAIFDEGADYLERKVFDIAPELSTEISAKLAAMAKFADEFRPVVLGSNGGAINITDPQPVRARGRKQP